jgi:hypothetical protein
MTLRGASLVGAIGLVACGEPAERVAPDAIEAPASPEPATPTPPPSEPVDAGAGTTDGETGEVAPDEPQTAPIDAVGVASCDEYIAAYRACLDKAPPSERAAHERTLGEQVHAWKQTLDGAPNAQKAVEIGCRGARAAAAEATGPWGCAM